MSPVKGFYIKGARISMASQALMYKGIIDKKQAPKRKGTTIYLDMTRWAIKDFNRDPSTNQNI